MEVLLIKTEKRYKLRFDFNVFTRTRKNNISMPHSLRKIHKYHGHFIKIMIDEEISLVFMLLN